MILKSIIQEIKTIAESHAQVKGIVIDDLERIDNEAAESYPLIVISPSSFDVISGTDQNQHLWYIDVICLDRQLQDNSNLIDCYNDTHAILMDIMAELQKDDLPTMYGTNGQATKLSSQALTHAAGWSMQYRVVTQWQRDTCFIP